MFLALLLSSVIATLEPAANRKAAPALQLRDGSGNTVDLSKYRGKVVLLDFWATECGGCKIEVPWFVAFQKAYKKKGLAVVGVSMDILYEDLKGPEEGWHRVNPFVASRHVNYPIVMGDAKVTQDYDIKALPATYLLDRKGNVAAKYVGLVDKADIQMKIESLLKE